MRQFDSALGPEAGISKNYCAANSGSPKVELRFCSFHWLILFKYWTGWPDLRPSLCPYYVYARRGAALGLGDRTSGKIHLHRMTKNSALSYCLERRHMVWNKMDKQLLEIFNADIILLRYFSFYFMLPLLTPLTVFYRLLLKSSFLLRLSSSLPRPSFLFLPFSFFSSLGRYVFGSEISYNKAPPRLPGLAY